MVGKILGRLALPAGAGFVLYLGVVVVAGTYAAVSQSPGPAADVRNATNNRALFLTGRRVFRFDTFGDEAFRGGALQLHRAIAGRRNGGVGVGVSPKTALSVGLKVDASAIPKQTAGAIKARLQGNWAADVAAYDKIHDHALHLSDLLSDGLIKQFPERFRGPR